MRTTQRELRVGNPSLDEMRFDLAEQEAMNMSVSGTIDMLIYGVEPLDEISETEIREEWERTFGQLKNWETNND